jgi:hypothetical protein
VVILKKKKCFTITWKERILYTEIWLYEIEIGQKKCFIWGDDLKGHLEFTEIWLPEIAF